MSTIVEIYARIQSAMSDDAEVVALCEKYLKKARANSALTLARKEAVLSALGKVDDVEAGETAAGVAEMMNEGNMDVNVAKDGLWSTQAVGYYLRKLRDEGKVIEHEGKPKTYSLAE